MDIKQRRMGSCMSYYSQLESMPVGVTHKPMKTNKGNFVPLLILSDNQPPTGRRAPATRDQQR